MRTIFLISFLLMPYAVVRAGQTDTPPADAPVTRIVAGELRGVIESEQSIARLRAVSRVTGEQDAPAAFEPKTGQFRFAELPGNATYDLCITLETGRRLEGVDLHWLEADLLRLAPRRREQLDVAATPDRPFERGDADTILAGIRHRKDFFDTQRVLVLRGDGSRAVALVELLRTREFHDADPEDLIWRIELWYFRRVGQGWERIANSEKLLERFRGPREDWSKIDLYYLPTLSFTLGPDGTLLASGCDPAATQACSQPVSSAPASRPAMLHVDLPAAPNSASGRPSESSPALETEPILLFPEKR